MYKSVFWIVCLLLVSTGVMAAPRTSIRDGSQVGGIAMEKMGVPVSTESRHFEAAEPQISAAEALPEFYSPSTGNDGTDAIGNARFEATGKPRNRSRDILIPFTAQDHSDGKTVIAGGLVIKRTEAGVDIRNEANAATEAMPAQIKLVLHQPAAPPVVNNRSLAPSQA